MKRNNSAQFDQQNGFEATGWCAAFEVVDQSDGFLRNGENQTIRNVERSIAYMAAHLNEPLKISTLAVQANVSPSHFFALFKRLTGCPPMDYFTRLRMLQARKLLDSTSASIKEVAAALGYQDPLYFSRVFKSFNKVPPSRYRVFQVGSAQPEKHSLAPLDVRSEFPTDN